MIATTAEQPLCCARTRPDIAPSRSVCKQLFGPVDHEQLKTDHRREIQKLYDEQNLRWNFDFAKDTPLPGRFCWEEAVATKEPSSSCTLVDTCEGSARSHGRSSNDISGSDAGLQGDRSTNIDCKRRDVTKKRTLTGKMTDFLRQKKCRLASAEGKATKRTSGRLSRQTTNPRQGNLDNFVTRP